MNARHLSRGIAAATGLAAGLLAGCTPPSPVDVKRELARVAGYERVASWSMEPTLRLGELVDVHDYGDREPQVGDIVVFHPPANMATIRCAEREAGRGTRRPCGRSAAATVDIRVISRVVGVAGDRIAIVGGRVVRDGERADEPFADVSHCDASEDTCDMPDPIVVPGGHVYVVADSRGRASDSRLWGPVRVADVRGYVD